MNRTERTQLHILEVLRDASPNMEKENALYSAVNVESSVHVTKGDFEAALAALENAEGGAQVFGTRTPTGVKWKITAEGLARLAGV